jgi:PKD repeat protein
MKSVTWSALLLVLLLVSAVGTVAQPGEWTWMHGSAGAVAVYGTQGVPSPLNQPPSLYEACEFTDKQGNLWVFGGDGNLYADLWKFDPVTYEWTWMGGPATANACGNYGVKGVPAATNWPGSHAYGAYTFVDTTGDFWLFGGWGIDVSCTVGPLNDLWHLDLSTLTWTWMSGDNTTSQPGVFGTYQVFDPLNKPGARLEGATAWTDDNNYLWLFGGESAGGVHWNDMWKYDISTNQWAWMNGLNISGGGNVYGTKGISDPANTPGARQAYGRWKDLAGNLWLFGGTNYVYYASDLWKFNVTTNEWTWMSGADVGNSLGNAGALCASDTAFFPGNRYENRAAWVDLDGNFFLYGGRSDFSGDLNDLWKYCVASNEWSLVNGSTASNLPAVYGTLQVSAPTNFPGARFGAISWTDLLGNLWMFGGFTSLGDLWRFVPDPSCGVCSGLPTAAFSAPNHICPGTCTGFNNLSVYASSYQWTFQGGVPATSTDVNPSGICYSAPGSYDVSLVATNANGSDTLTLLNYITVYPYPPPQGIMQAGDTLFANQGSVSYQWYFGGTLIPGATNYFYVAPAGGDYNVVCTDNNGCEVEAAIFDVIASLEKIIGGDPGLEVFPNPAIQTITVTTSMQKGVVRLSIFNMLGEAVITYATTDAVHTSEVDVSGLPGGVYWLELASVKSTARTRFIKQ